MQASSPVLPIFRSPGQERVLTRLLLDDEHRWWTLTSLARAVAVSASNLGREITRLERAGLVETQWGGNTRRVRADRDSPFYGELRGLVTKAFGPVPIIGRELAAVAGVQRAYIFGSWARQHSGEPMDEPPRDIDVIVVGEPHPDQINAACRRAEDHLGREVAPVIVDPATWNGDRERPPFVTAVRAGPLIDLLTRDA